MVIGLEYRNRASVGLNNVASGQGFNENRPVGGERSFRARERR
jgi:hypothetical protein